MSTGPTPLQSELRRLQRQSLAVGVGALAVCVAGAFFSPAQFFRAYLAAYQFFVGIALGSLAILMLYHLTGGAWGFLVRRFLEAAMRTLPLLAVLFIPIALGLRYLYLWAHPEIVAWNKELEYNHIYLNAPFWYVRAVLFFVVWIGLATILSVWSRQQDESGSAVIPRKFRLLSAPGLGAYGVTITFASVDWLMSLQPTFHSTMFGPLYASAQLLTAMAFALVLLTWLVGRQPFRNLISADVLNDLGNLQFTFLVIWAYLTFFQFMLVWMANLPDEVIWYLPRSRGPWKWLAWAIFVFNFAIPFFLLLLRDVKREPHALGQVAGLLLFMQLVTQYWQILPVFEGPEWRRLLPDFNPGNIAAHWMDFVIPLGIGGIWFAYFLWQFEKRPVLPLHDPSRDDAAHLRARDEEEVRREAIRHG